MALKGNAIKPFTLLRLTSWAGMSELSLIYLPKTFHQENIYVEISSSYSPHEFHFLFILLTNSITPAVSKLPLLFSYMCIADFTLLFLHLFQSDCWNCFLSMCSVFCLGLSPPPPHWGEQWKRQERAGAWGKVPNVFKLKLQQWKACTPSILHFQYFHSREECPLSCTASYLTSFSHGSAAVPIQWSSRTMDNAQCCLPASLCVISST